MKISVVIATYDANNYLIQQLESIYNQSLKPDEIIIVDDASNVSIKCMIKEFITRSSIEIHYYRNERNIGYSQTFFKGLSYSSGDYIFFCDQDDVWHERKVEKMIECILEHQNIRCLSCRNILIDSEGIIIKKEKKNRTKVRKVSIESLIKQRELRPGMTLLIDKTLKNIILKSNYNNHKSHDRYIEFIACKNHSFYILEEYLNYYRIHNNNTSGVNLTLKPRSNLNGRISQINKEIYYLQLLHDEFLNDIISSVLEKYMRYYAFRKEKLYESSILKYIVGMIKYINYYSSIRIVLGDLYSIKNEKK
ncbi:MAG: glycosyltransferase [Eubacterium sp.]